MTGPLILKLLRDLRVPLTILVILLGGFEFLWGKVTDRITAQLLPLLLWLAAGRNVTPQQVEETIFSGPGRLTKAMVGGDNMSFFQMSDMLSIAYVHPLVQIILCIWAVGRAAGAIAGEIDRGTMELLLAQPLARFRILLAHLAVDAITIPILCLAMYVGMRSGIAAFGLIQTEQAAGATGTPITEASFFAALGNTATLVFALSGYTMWLSSMGRLRGRVMGVAVLITLVQYLINVIGQLWDVLGTFRPMTVFYYYQPQQTILRNRWMVSVVNLFTGETYELSGALVLFSVGAIGYALAFWTFLRRDVPAPL